jgi:hypothetical protein
LVAIMGENHSFMSNWGEIGDELLNFILINTINFNKIYI